MNIDFDGLVSHLANILTPDKSLVLAIDGPCGSGKTTLANRLSALFEDCQVIHADDFFLQPHQRTTQRLTEPGGNLDRERLLTEVLSHLNSLEPFIYHRYDCQTGLMQPQKVKPASLAIVEGAYSQHPLLRPYYDLTVFLTVDSDIQLSRLRARVPAKQLLRFEQEWIPMEQAYFSAYKIKEQSDFVLQMT